MGLQLVPSALVPAVRALLRQQGLDQYIVSNTGELDAGALITVAFDTVEVDTAFTPTVTFKLGGAPDPTAQALISSVRPRVAFSGRAGRFEIAPATTGSTLPIKAAGMNVGLGLGAAFTGLVLLMKAFSRR